MRALPTRLWFLLERMGESVGAWMGDFRSHRFCDQTATASCAEREKLIGSRPLRLPQ